MKLAEKTGLSDSQISAIETGAVRPSKAAVKNLCSVLGISEKWLRSKEGPMRPVVKDELSGMSLMTAEPPGQYPERRDAIGALRARLATNPALLTLQREAPGFYEQEWEPRAREIFERVERELRERVEWELDQLLALVSKLWQAEKKARRRL